MRQYRNEGDDQFNFENVYGDVNIQGSRSRKRPDRELAWLKAFANEVEGRLATSLHNQILINLGKEPQPEQVHRLWDMEVKSGQITETISPDTAILKVFDRPEIAGKLLILGKPGAGKTTTLLELARALVRRAIDDPSEPMPFLLNLSSWKDPKQNIKDWAIKELTTKGIGSKLSKKWLEDQKFLPLLDGLDEVRSDLQSACVKAINQWMSGEGQPRAIIVCSRQEEYELYSEKLNLNGAIYLQELSDDQIESYLNEVDRASLWEVLATDTALLDLVRQPLLLSITLVAYREELASQWRELRATQERLAFLLNAYVEKMLVRQSKNREYIGKTEPASEQTRHFLKFLAKQLERESTTEFLIERMQPTWLTDNKHVSIYQSTVGTWIGTIVSSYFIVSFLKLYESIFSTSLWIALGVIMGLLFGSQNQSFSKIETVETIQLFWNVARKQFLQILVSNLILIFLFSFICFILIQQGILTRNLPSEILQEAPGFLVTLFLIALVLSAVRGLWGGREVENKSRANEGIWISARITISFLVALGAIKILLAFYRKPDTYCIVLLLLALRLGGQACIQHFSLRFILFLNGSIPWNYARFLNYATERMFLQRIGGRYRFIHKLLQDHFAQMGD